MICGASLADPRAAGLQRAGQRNRIPCRVVDEHRRSSLRQVRRVVHGARTEPAQAGLGERRASLYRRGPRRRRRRARLIGQRPQRTSGVPRPPAATARRRPRRALGLDELQVEGAAGALQHAPARQHAEVPVLRQQQLESRTTRRRTRTSRPGGRRRCTRTMPNQCIPQAPADDARRREWSRSRRRRSKSRGAGRRSRSGSRPRRGSRGCAVPSAPPAPAPPRALLDRAPMRRAGIVHAQLSVAGEPGRAVDAGPAASAAACALTITFMPPWRYSSTSRERWRATGLKPISSRTWPRACGRGVATSTNSIPCRPSGLDESTMASRSGGVGHGGAPRRRQVRRARARQSGDEKCASTRAASATETGESSNAPMAWPTAIVPPSTVAQPRAGGFQQGRLEAGSRRSRRPTGRAAAGPRPAAGQTLVHAGGRGVDQARSPTSASATSLPPLTRAAVLRVQCGRRPVARSPSRSTIRAAAPSGAARRGDRRAGAAGAEGTTRLRSACGSARRKPSPSRAVRVVADQAAAAVDDSVHRAHRPRLGRQLVEQRDHCLLAREGDVQAGDPSRARR